MAADERISTLVKWATSHGASLHPSVEVYDDPTTGLSFRVKEGSPALEPWDRIVSLPSTLTLSYLNAVQDESQPPFQGAFMAQTPPHVVGRFFLMWQYLLGGASPWWAYIQALPQPDDEEGSWQLAPFWPAEDAELLEGTNVEVGLEKIRRDVRNEYSRAAELFAAGLGGGDDDDGRAGRITTGLYQWAYCVFSSRSFRPSLVVPETELPAGVKMDDFSVLLPLFDIGNHDMTLDVKWDVILHPTNKADTTTTNGTNSPPPPSSTCELRAGRPFQPGQQVFNNYSMKTNAELLLGYGFLLPPTPALHNDYIHVRKRAASAAASEEYYISLRPLADPSSLLGRHRQSFVVVEEEEEESGVLGAFSHLQTDMVWDIFTTILAGSGASVDDVLPVPEGAEDGEAARRQAFFAGRVGEACGGFVEQTAAVIQHKVLQELERLDETEVEVAEEDRERLTGNQRLALEYRGRCRAVLESTLEAMEATFNGGE